MENEIKTGTPSMLLLPAKEYSIKSDENFYTIEIPRKGVYHDIAPDIFTEKDGEFNILDDVSNILYLPSITKVLFAIGKYPELRHDQFFVPVYLKFKSDTVLIVGTLITILSNEADKIESW